MHSAEDALDPEDRQIDETDPQAKKDKMLDKTIADTFPASDPRHPFLIRMRTRLRASDALFRPLSKDCPELPGNQHLLFTVVGCVNGCIGKRRSGNWRHLAIPLIDREAEYSV